MDSAISTLLGRYESGKISRRAFVQGMAALAATAAGSATAAAADFKVDSVNHVSLLVSDLQKSADFYKRVLGAPVEKRGAEMLATYGSNRLVMRVGKPAGTVERMRHAQLRRAHAGRRPVRVRPDPRAGRRATGSLPPRGSWAGGPSSGISC